MTVNLHRLTARTEPLWAIGIQPSANGPVELTVRADTLEAALDKARDWLAKTSYTNPLFVSAVAIGEVVT